MEAKVSGSGTQVADWPRADRGEIRCAGEQFMDNVVENITAIGTIL